MRYIPLKGLINTIFTDATGVKDKARLFRAHKKVAKLAPAVRQKHIRKNGSTKWTPIKNRLTAILGNKCWYTEVELVGAPLTVDHFRPVCDYWWLAFDVENYRVACAYSNSSAHNETHGCAGGKGDEFPLLGAGVRATGKTKLRIEKPMILDPCNQADCDLLVFQALGHPILNPIYAADPIAAKRVTESKLLLNLDHPDFNSKREQLCNDILFEVRTYEGLHEGAADRAEILAKLKGRLDPNAPFSTAARQYLQFRRDLNWVNDLLEM